MIKKKNKFLIFILAVTLCLGGCGLSQGDQGAPSDDTLTLNIAYQYGLSYAPAIICKEKKLIENAYLEKTGKTININWNQISSGSDINIAFASGSLDVACIGVAPAIIGISNNVGYKIFTNISGQEHGLMTDNPDINSLADYIGSDNQIALVNISSIQHIILAMALVENGYDAHALDSNIVAMKHPEGKLSLESGIISGHLTSNPYIYLERNNERFHELEEVKNAWPADNSFIVGIASEKVHKDAALYSVICDAFTEAIGFINSCPEEAAAITCETDGNSREDELAFILSGSYETKTTGVFTLADFMYRNQFISDAINAYDDLIFENVQGD